MQKKWIKFWAKEIAPFLMKPFLHMFQMDSKKIKLVEKRIGEKNIEKKFNFVCHYLAVKSLIAQMLVAGAIAGVSRTFLFIGGASEADLSLATTSYPCDGSLASCVGVGNNLLVGNTWRL